MFVSMKAGSQYISTFCQLSMLSSKCHDQTCNQTFIIYLPFFIFSIYVHLGSSTYLVHKSDACIKADKLCFYLFLLTKNDHSQIYHCKC